MNVRHDLTKIENRDGLVIVVQQWLPPTETRIKQVVLIVHGFAEHAGRYAWIAEKMASAGYAVYAFDLRGHGQSEGKRGHILNFKEYVDDLNQMIDHTLKSSGKEKIILLGHSMGGLIVADRMIQTEEGVKGAAYSSPFFRLGAPVPGWKKIMSRLLSKVVPGLGMANEIDPKLISRDPKEVEEYASDPLIFHIARARWFTECLSAQARIPVGIGNLQAKQGFFIAGADGLAEPKQTLSIAGAVPEERRTLKRYADAHHEIFHDLCREEAAADLLDWLEKIDDPPPKKKPRKKQ